MDDHIQGNGNTRRNFLGAALTAASYNRVLGANDRVRLGLAGYGLIGAFHTQTYKKLSDVEWAAVSDVYKPRVEAGLAAMGSQAKGYSRIHRNSLMDAGS